jgi:hypothetical protein
LFVKKVSIKEVMKTQGKQGMNISELNIPTYQILIDFGITEYKEF